MSLFENIFVINKESNLSLSYNVVDRLPKSIVLFLDIDMRFQDSKTVSPFFLSWVKSIKFSKDDLDKLILVIRPSF